MNCYQQNEPQFDCNGHIATRTCATARPQLAKADTAFQAHPLVNLRLR